MGPTLANTILWLLRLGDSVKAPQVAQMSAFHGAGGVADNGQELAPRHWIAAE